MLWQKEDRLVFADAMSSRLDTIPAAATGSGTELYEDYGQIRTRVKDHYR
jgi:hypothetical protein